MVNVPFQQPQLPVLVTVTYRVLGGAGVQQPFPGNEEGEPLELEPQQHEPIIEVVANHPPLLPNLHGGTYRCPTTEHT